MHLIMRNINKVNRGLRTLAVAWLLGAGAAVSAQCTGGTFAGTISPTSSWQFVTINYQEYVEFDPIAGAIYEFSLCDEHGADAYGDDTEITILDNTGTPVTFDDDGCAQTPLASYVVWTAPSNATGYRVLVTEYNCSGSLYVDMAYRRTIPVAIDAAFGGADLPGKYIIYPTSQLQTLNFSNIQVANVGTTGPINITPKVEILNSAMQVVQTLNGTTQSVASMTLGAAQNLGTWTPPANPESYTLYYIAQTSGDLDPSNDTAYWNIEVSDSVYAKDYGVANNNFVLGGNGGVGAKSALVYTVLNTDVITSVSAFLRSSAPVSQGVMYIYTANASGPQTLLATTNTFSVTSSTLSWVTVSVPGNLTLTPGDYAIVIETTSGNLSLGYSNAVFENNTMFLQDAGVNTWTPIETYLDRTGMLRMNFGPVCAATASFNNTISTCGQSNGAVNMTLTGLNGTSPTFQWDNGDTTQNLTNVGPGTYNVIVTDAGCTYNFSTTITTTPVVSATFTSNDADCATGMGSISLNIASGIAPYSYAWSNGSTAATLTAGPGTYSVTVTDSAGCTLNLTGLTINPNPSAPSVQVTVVDPTCFGGTGSATALGSGTVAPYTYLWSNGDNNDTMVDTAGNYTVTVTDGNGCSVVGNATLTAPAPLQAQFNNTPPTCNQNNGTVSVVVTGGTSPYTYDWNNGGNTTDTWTNVGVGPYSVVVTDINNCTQTFSTQLTTTGGPVVQDSVISPLCNGQNGTIILNITGNGPFNVQWTHGPTGATISDTAGTYHATVSDNNGCSVNVGPIVITEPAALSTITSTTAESAPGANDGSASVTVTGGTAPYNYQWNNGAQTQTNTGIGAGLYVVTVTDANGCTATDSATVTTSSGIVDNNTASMNLYPNPASDFTTIEFNGMNGMGELQVVDMSGRVVFTTEVNLEQPYQLNLQGLAPAVYSVHVKSGSMQQVLQLIRY